ncbi:MAG TPA: hypothetical protein PK939_03270 [Bacteroidales bacterium]|nr:hypothetical protein [Bacteroidales bacterium]
MKQLSLISLFFMLIYGTVLAQEPENFISCEVNGKSWKAEAKKMKIPAFGFEYLAIAAFQVSPDVQVWIRMYYFKDELKPGTYPVISEETLQKTSKKKKAEDNAVWVLIDYTEETKGLGHAFHDGESLSGTLVIEELGEKYIKGTFEAQLAGVYYKKRTMATVTGSGIRGNLEDKLLTKAGGGMLANGDPHEHANTKKQDETDSIVLSKGSFFVDWSKPEKKEKENEDKQ